MNITTKIKDRFFAKVNKTSGCWYWTGVKNDDGYGYFKLNGKMISSHRLMWLFLNGKIPKNICICHTCDNPGCVNPKHLWLGTRKDNMIDMANKGRMNTKGEINGRSKLNVEKVIKIRKLYTIGNITMEKLGNKFGVTKQQIYHIINNISWTHI